MSINSENNTIAGGWIEVICGCMFSGKTEELIKRINEAKVPASQIKIFKPAIENRYHDNKVVSHNGTSIEAMAIKDPQEILSYCKDVKVIGIDEAQFFDETIVDVCNTMANMNIRVIVAGLDMDYKGKPFGPMPNLLAVAEYVTKLQAKCSISGDPASFSFRKNNSNDNILLGANEYYEARSRRFFYENSK